MKYEFSLHLFPFTASLMSAVSPYVSSEICSRPEELSVHILSFSYEICTIGESWYMSDPTVVATSYK